MLCSCIGGRPAAGAAAQASSSGAAAAVTSFDVEKVQLVEWSLQGVPSSCVAVADDCYIIGDDRAGESVVPKFLDH